MMNVSKKVELFLIGVIFMACNGSPAPVSADPPQDDLDVAIRETSDYLNRQIPAGNKLVILNIQSDFPALSEYIIDELIANTVNDQIFSVVDRQQLNTIRAELDFQMSGEVDDDTAQALGRMAGAQIIISGAVSQIGDLYRLRVRALSVQTASIEGQFNRNISNGPTVTALVRSRAMGYGDGAATARVQPGTVSTAIDADNGPAIAPPSVAPASQTRRQISEEDLVGVWKGSYFNSSGEVALILTVYEEGGRYMAIFDFYNLPGRSNSREGKYYMNVSYNQAREKFYLKGVEWIEKPGDYVFADLEGTITGNVFGGFVSNISTNNRSFRVVKQ
jgi:hypothetical protein